MNRIKTIKIITFLLIILLIGYFYSLEIKKNAAELQNFKLIMNIYYLIIALSLFLIACFFETFIWKVCINKHLGRRQLNFFQSIAVVNASGLLRYLPGRVWTYTAQLIWLKKYGISTSIVLYVNLICILGSVLVSFYLGLMYMALYTDVMGVKAIVLSFILLILFNTVYVIWNAALMNKLIAFLNKLYKKDIRPLSNSGSLLLFYSVYLYVQLAPYWFQWLFFGKRNRTAHPPCGYLCPFFFHVTVSG